MSGKVLVLDFLTNGAGLDLVAAASLVDAFVQAGRSTSASIFATTDKDLKEFVSKPALRKKILAAIRKGPKVLEQKDEPSKKRAAALEPDAKIIRPCLLPVGDLHGVVRVNRSPVMILWGAVVAHTVNKLEWEESLSVSSVVASLNAKAKAARIWGEAKKEEGGRRKEYEGPISEVSLLGRSVTACSTFMGLRGCLEGQVVHPKSPADRLAQAFPGKQLDVMFSAMLLLAEDRREEILRDSHRAYSLYEQFRPSITDGAAGWGAAGDLDVKLILELCKDFPLGRQEGKVKTELPGKEQLLKEAMAAAGGLSKEELENRYGEEVRVLVEEMQLEGLVYEKEGCIFCL
eukprot:757120-Hanusia_phi.AAC.3